MKPRCNHDIFLYRLLSVHSDGLRWQYPNLHQFLEEGPVEKATLRDLPGNADRPGNHHHLQFYRRWVDEIFTGAKSHHSNCGRDYSLLDLLKNDFPCGQGCKYRAKPRRRALYRAARDSSSSRPGCPSSRHDLCEASREQLSHGRRHFTRLDRLSGHPVTLCQSAKNPRQSRDHGDGKIDGAHLDSDLGANVFERLKRIHPIQSYALTVSYFGAPYFGWQKTAAGPSIQDTLQQALTKLLNEPISCEAASRTDRGVHAAGQIVQFSTTKDIPEKNLQSALNGLLPKTIRIVAAIAVSPSFHPTLDAKNKTYHYFICYGPIQDPFERTTSWHYPHPLDLEAMRQAATEWIGTHDFSRFSTEIKKNPICTLTQITIAPLPNQRLQLSITGDRFLYKMMRRLSGTLAQIGAGKIQPGQVGLTAPPRGLILHKIEYSESNRLR